MVSIRAYAYRVFLDRKMVFPFELSSSNTSIREIEPSYILSL